MARFNAVRKALPLPPEPKRPKHVQPRWQEYTAEPGQWNRGNHLNLYDCNRCEHGEHEICEKEELIMCRCWRTRHTLPPNKRSRSRTPRPRTVLAEETVWEDA